MALTIGDNFSYQGAKPLDTRLVYDTLAQMKAKEESTLYPGIIAFCKADGKNYQWKPTNAADPTLGKWREFESGGGGSDNVVEGYRNPANGLFYEEAAFTTAIAGASKTIYVDIPNNLPYRWDGTAFVAIAGSGGHEIRDSDDNTMTARDALQFAGDLKTEDDSTTGAEKTVVSPHRMTSAEWTEIINPIPDPVPVTGGGHTIQDTDGSSLTQRRVLQFAGDLEAMDDSTTSGSEKTVVTPHALTSSEWGEVVTPLPGQRKEGIIIDERGNEYVVGEYIQADGKKKPLYQKTFTGLNIPVSWNGGTYFVQSNDISSIIAPIKVNDIISCYGTVYSTALGYITSNSTPMGVFNYGGTEIRIAFVMNMTSSDSVIGFTLKYTKTTDIAT